MTSPVATHGFLLLRTTFESAESTKLLLMKSNSDTSVRLQREAPDAPLVLQLLEPQEF